VTSLSPLLVRLGLAACLALAGAGCTDADVFEIPSVGKGQQDNKLRVRGSFCTEHPDELQFPVKIMFVIDCSQSMNVTDPPPSPTEYPGRVRAVWEVIQKFRNDPGVEFAVVRFEAAANVATQRDTNNDGVADMFGFVNDLPTLLRALNSLQAAGGNTSYQAALGLAEATLAMDMANANVDERSRAKYVVIFLSDGLPYPVDYQMGTNTPASIRRAVREMMNLADRFEVGELVVHTAFLAVDTPAFIEAQAEALLGGMAEDGGGTYRNFDNGEQINFLDIDFTSIKRMYSLKDGAFLVTNQSANPAWDPSQGIDTDGDGLIDRLEVDLGSDVGLRDTDGDGFNDFLEYTLRRSGFDPLDPDDADCQLVLDRLDNDGDGLLNCEERFLGTSPDLFDTDADGLPDPLEVRAGTNPVYADDQIDQDYDGTQNASEVAWHTNPSDNDAAQFSKLAYRYQLGRIPGVYESRLCYEFDVENITLVGTEPRALGEPRGYNDILVYAGQVPNDDPEDSGAWRVACARVRYVPRYPEPDIKVPPTGRVTFQQRDFKRPVARACGSDAECPHHVCEPESHVCMAPLGERCDASTPCGPFACVPDDMTGQGYCASPVAVSCLAADDCPAYPLHPLTGMCMDPAGSPPDPLTQQCPRRECVPQYPTCQVSSDCLADGDSNPDNDPLCLQGLCRVSCQDAAGCNPGETCDLDGEAEYGACAGPADCTQPGTSCVGGVCRRACVTSADCASLLDTCEADVCVSRHCVDHHGGSCVRVPCAADADCPRMPCDPEVGRCRTQACLDSRDCPHQACELVVGKCMGTTCEDDRDCRGERGFSCNPVVGEPCVRDLDCPFDFCTQKVFRCSLGARPDCVLSADCPANTCDVARGRCALEERDCVSDLQCTPNTCNAFTVCANDPSVGCTLSIDCPQTYCRVDGTCLNDPARACDPTQRYQDADCQLGVCAREDGLGSCDTEAREPCTEDSQCPPYACNPISGLCAVPVEVVCRAAAECPAGMECVGGSMPSTWGKCQKACNSDADCPTASCQGRCRPVDPPSRQRCTDWFDPDRDCKLFD